MLFDKTLNQGILTRDWVVELRQNDSSYCVSKIATLKLVLLSVLLVWNIVVLLVYGLDKHRLFQHKRRISESVLLQTRPLVLVPF